MSGRLTPGTQVRHLLIQGVGTVMNSPANTAYSVMVSWPSGTALCATAALAVVPND